jgi:DNA-binding transcriptional LysR family regulator
VLDQEPRLVALAAAHPLASHQSLTFADLREESFITNPVERADGARPARWLAEQRHHGLPGRVAARSAGVVEVLTLVAAGRGVCLVPSAVARHYPRDDVAYVLVEDAEPAVVSLAWRPGSPSVAVAAFIDTARHVAASKSGSAARLSAH